MTAASLDALTRAVIGLAQSESLLTWESIKSNLIKDGFGCAKIENAKNNLLRTYLNAHQRHAEDLVRGQQLTPISIPDTQSFGAGAHLENSPPTSERASGPDDLPNSIFLIVDDNFDTISCEHDLESDESLICKGALEQRWIDRYVPGQNIVLSWRKKDCMRTYKTSFVVVHDQSMEYDIKFGANWLRGAPIQAKLHQERKRKTTYDEFDDIARPCSKRQNQLRPEDLDLASDMIGRAVHKFITSDSSARYQHSPRSSSERIQDTDGGDWVDS